MRVYKALKSKSKDESEKIDISIGSIDAPQIVIENNCKNVAPEKQPLPAVKAAPSHGSQGSQAVPKKEPPQGVINLLKIIQEPTENTEQWTKVVAERNVTFYKKQVAGCPVVLVKGTAIIEGIPLNVMWRAIADLELRKKWETVFSAMEVVDQNQETGDEIVYFVLKTPFGIQERDFLQRRSIIHDYPTRGQTVIHFESVEHPLRPEIKKCIRAHTYISGYVFKEISQFPLRCELHIVSQTDIKGMIPKTIINMFAASRTKAWVEAFKKGCEKLMDGMRKNNPKAPL